MSHDFEAMRLAMVESQLRTTGVDDARVVRAMATVARERFVPAERQALAYAETLLPLGGGRRLNLPMATGKLLTELALGQADRVLVVGAASGYSAALCSKLAGSVVALESDPAIAAIGAEVLSECANVELVEGPLEAGWQPGAPYDAVLIDGVVEIIPDTIIEQLADHGRLAAGLVEDGVVRLVYGRRQDDAFGTVAFADAQSAPLPGFEKPRAFVF